MAGLRSANGLAGVEHALRAMLRTWGHKPERKTEERYGQSSDGVVLYCALCSDHAVAHVVDDRATITGDAVTKPCRVNGWPR